ncbi:MAG: glutaminyl-peptide cyclotransferase [bacterium]
MDNEYDRKQFGLTFIFILLFITAVLPVNAQIISGSENVTPYQLFLDPDSLPVYGYSVVSAFPHDSNAFTQGLIYKNNALYEGTGLYAQSTLRKVELTTGSILKIHHLNNSYFGEGITMWQDTIIQITWREHTGYVYIEQDTFQLIDSFSYSTEGWGLTHDDTCLIMSDGTSRIYYLDPQTYVEVGYIDVEAEGSPVVYLNELEYIQGSIYANVWYCDSIAIIDPQTGDVTAWLNLSALSSGQPNVLNGIAYDGDDVRLFVTGKLWPTLYEIEVDPLNYPPEIIAYDPPSPCYINIDSVLVLTVMVQDPDPQDSLSYTWSINGIIDTTAHDTSYSYSSALTTTDTVMFKVDDGMFCDSIIWIVVVLDPGVVTEKADPITNSGVFLSCCPNPCREKTRIAYGVGRNARDNEIQIYDASGRLIRDFSLSAAYSLVPAVIPWDGTDNFDNKVTAGIYFVILKTENSRVTEKVVFLH